MNNSTAQPAAAKVFQPFPEGFLWGVAISGFQNDMGQGALNDENSDWWVWVRDPDNIATGKVSGDLPEDGPGFYKFYGKAARQARRLGANAFRMSIEWSRVFPTSTAAVDILGGFTPAVLAERGVPRRDDRSTRLTSNVTLIHSLCAALPSERALVPGMGSVLAVNALGV